jgi:hypothetical protein
VGGGEGGDEKVIFKGEIDMHIKSIDSQNRRDFMATMECEHCGHIAPKVSGYDDAYFHSQVIPAMKCASCGLSAPDTYSPLTTKYAAHEVV